MSENYETKLIGIQNGRNFRELGGYKTISGQTIKYNKLLRTGNLADLSSSDLELLQKHGVKYDVDFRTEKEKMIIPIVFQKALNMFLIQFLVMI